MQQTKQDEHGVQYKTLQVPYNADGITCTVCTVQHTAGTTWYFWIQLLGIFCTIQQSASTLSIMKQPLLVLQYSILHVQIDTNTSNRTSCIVQYTAGTYWHRYRYQNSLHNTTMCMCHSHLNCQSVSLLQHPSLSSAHLADERPTVTGPNLKGNKLNCLVKNVLHLGESQSAAAGLCHMNWVTSAGGTGLCWTLLEFTGLQHLCCIKWTICHKHHCWGSNVSKLGLMFKGISEWPIHDIHFTSVQHCIFTDSAESV